MEDWWGEHYKQATNMRARNEAAAVRQAEVDAVDAVLVNNYQAKLARIAIKDNGKESTKTTAGNKSST